MKKGAIFRWNKQIFLFVVLLIVALVRVRLLDFPFERDEGEYAYMAQLMLEGIPPYKEAYSIKLPGVHFIYALFMLIFGKTMTGIHFGLLVVNQITILMIFLLFRTIFNSYIGFFSSVSYGLLSLSPSVLGFAGHATNFVVLFALIGVYFLYKGIESKRRLFFVVSGLLLGISFLMKQHALFFILFACAYFIYIQLMHNLFNLKSFLINSIFFAVSVSLPFVLTMTLVYVWGVHDKFWFWTFTYAANYATGNSFSYGMMSLKYILPKIMGNYAAIWLLAVVGCFALLVSNWDRNKKAFANLFLLFSIFSVVPGFHFREHYFISLLPAISLMAAICLYYFKNIIAEKPKKIFFAIPLIIFISTSMWALIKDVGFYFQNQTSQLSRSIYGFNPFSESLKIAQYIKQNTNDNDRIAVVGSEPQIFFYSDRKSATGYIYTYPMMEIHDYNLWMQKEMAAEIEKSQPAMVVFINIYTSWIILPQSPQYIFNWVNDYIKSQYELVLTVDLISKDRIIYRFGNDAKNYRPASKDFINVYRRIQKI